MPLTPEQRAAGNEPAFPMPASEHSQGGHFEQNGMSLQQWYAGQALAGITANPSFFGSLFQQQPEAAANFAMQCADAMLAYRMEAPDA